MDTRIEIPKAFGAKWDANARDHLATAEVLDTEHYLKVDTI